MCTYKIKIVNRTPQKLKIKLKNMPHQIRYIIIRKVMRATTRLFEDPAIMADYQKWKKARQQKKEFQECRI